MRIPIVIALDPPLGVDVVKWSLDIVSETSDLVVGYKIGLPLVLRVGDRVVEITRAMKESELVVADLKLADIGDIMALVADQLAEMGFNAIISHAFIGWSKGLETLANKAFEKSLKLITVLSMSHPGSSEVIDKNYEKLLEITLRARAWGCVIGANKEELIRKTKGKARENGLDLKVLSPGIGFQGIPPATAIRAGADYEIIGRLITCSSKPRDKLFELMRNYYGVKS
ncbi:MAG: orotidine-5'-phosphate decarboxylase [Thermoprotei archaeon]